MQGSGSSAEMARKRYVLFAEGNGRCVPNLRQHFVYEDCWVDDSTVCLRQLGSVIGGEVLRMPKFSENK